MQEPFQKLRLHARTTAATDPSLQRRRERLGVVAQQCQQQLVLAAEVSIERSTDALRLRSTPPRGSRPWYPLRRITLTEASSNNDRSSSGSNRRGRPLVRTGFTASMQHPQIRQGEAYAIEHPDRVDQHRAAPGHPRRLRVRATRAPHCPGRARRWWPLPRRSPFEGTELPGEHQPGGSPSCTGGNTHRLGHTRCKQRRLRHGEIDQRHRFHIRIDPSRCGEINKRTGQRGAAHRAVKTGDHRVERSNEVVVVVVVSSPEPCAPAATLVSSTRGNSTCNDRSISGRCTPSSFAAADPYASTVTGRGSHRWNKRGELVPTGNHRCWGRRRIAATWWTHQCLMSV